ncbi:dihydrofolate reductase family protein [Fischerella sp. JS2]|uniref:dihydrofolate reductase family protein n=1 Tax=Fischerella sp. JS2 TaxID=2597771 RepID=UPI0028EBC285|nr:dihydrofolate reductase family protein [Fischerella sp. JS2]
MGNVSLPRGLTEIAAFFITEAHHMKTQYYTASSLDGFIADADDSLDWLFQFGDGSETSCPQFFSEVGAIAMGSTTYEWILKHESWSYEQPTWVFSSRTLPKVKGANIHFANSNVQSVHAEMTKAAGGKNIWVMGGGDLAGQFFDAGLLDEIIVTIASVTLGNGAPLLPRSITTPPLKLLSATTYGTAFAELRYEVCK